MSCDAARPVSAGNHRNSPTLISIAIGHSQFRHAGGGGGALGTGRPPGGGVLACFDTVRTSLKTLRSRSLRILGGGRDQRHGGHRHFSGTTALPHGRTSGARAGPVGQAASVTLTVAIIPASS